MLANVSQYIYLDSYKDNNDCVDDTRVADDIECQWWRILQDIAEYCFVGLFGKEL